MASLRWTTSHAVFVTELDDDHKEIFAALAEVETAVDAGTPAAKMRSSIDLLVSRIEGHFGHEERLMRAARYPSFRWHKQQHDCAHKRVAGFVARIQAGDAEARTGLVRYLASFLHDHTRLPDRMLAAYLRNRERSIGKLILRAGTRPADSCLWVDANGHRLDPHTGEISLRNRCKRPS
jgi:hemerythrin